MTTLPVVAHPHLLAVGLPVVGGAILGVVGDRAMIASVEFGLRPVPPSDLFLDLDQPLAPARVAQVLVASTDLSFEAEQIVGLFLRGADFSDSWGPEDVERLVEIAQVAWAD